MASGIIFDIQRCGLHDGPGIRTVVFLKGCPLRCVWCHNPESQARAPQVDFRPEACVQCGACASVCEHGAHHLDGTHTYDRAACVVCGRCIEECLFDALKRSGRTVTVDAVITEALRDRAYYAQSGGGITLTGGEPLAQPAFCRELLAAARAEGLHTCLETSGYAARAVLESVLPLVDLFLFDYKATGEDHKALTGAAPDPILGNLDCLLAAGARVWLRCPLVPGVNDTEAHFQAIARLAEQYPQIEQIDLLPYHNVGSDKYRRFGLVDPLPGIATTSEAEKARWGAILQGLGCRNVSIG